MAQWIRHRPTEPGIAGSSPAGVISGVKQSNIAIACLTFALQSCSCEVTAARLAQSAERKALNLVVVGSSPTVGDLYFKRVLDEQIA